MKPKSIRIIAVFTAVFILLGAIACAKSASSSPAAAPNAYATYDQAMGMDTGYFAAEAAEEDYMPTEAKAAVSTAQAGRDSVPVDTERKLIRDANLTVETKEFDALLDGLQKQIASFGGYVESMSESGNSYRSTNRRHAYLSARVPSDRLDAFLNVVGEMGNVVQKGVSTRDVTSSYVDMESRLKVLETEKESLQKIMANAETTTEMLETQSRLYDVIEEIESYEAKKRTYDSLISYSTVSIDVQEVIDLTPAIEETRWEELSRRFTQSLGDLGEAIVDFGIGFIVALPWLLVIGGVCTAVFLAIFLPIRAKNRKRKIAKDVEKTSK